jgi:hypothetical protein
MKADLRISIKDYCRNKSLEVLVYGAPFPPRGYLVTLSGRHWRTRPETVGLTRVLAALKRALVRRTRCRAEADSRRKVHHPGGGSNLAIVLEMG